MASLGTTIFEAVLMQSKSCGIKVKLTNQCLKVKMLRDDYQIAKLNLQVWCK